MPNCPKCGAEYTDEAVCPVCGEELKAAESDNGAEEAVSLFSMADTTDSYDAEDIEKNKIYSILSYLGFLVFIPAFAAKESPFARYHTNQGLVLLVAEIIAALISVVLGVMPVVGTLLALLIGLPLYLLTVVYMALGIVNAYSGKAKELPFLGRFRILK